MNEFTKEQASVIHDMDSYREVTGAKRFKRTADEMERGLSPEEALQERITMVASGPTKDETPKSGGNRKQNTGPRPSTSRKGDILIRIRPAAGIDPEYFGRLPKGQIEIVMDEKWYAWYDTKVEWPYNNDQKGILEDILNMGIGEVITRVHNEEDIE